MQLSFKSNGTDTGAYARVVAEGLTFFWTFWLAESVQPGGGRPACVGLSPMMTGGKLRTLKAGLSSNARAGATCDRQLRFSTNAAKLPMWVCTTISPTIQPIRAADRR